MILSMLSGGCLVLVGYYVGKRDRPIQITKPDIPFHRSKPVSLEPSQDQWVERERE